MRYGVWPRRFPRRVAWPHPRRIALPARSSRSGGSRPGRARVAVEVLVEQHQVAPVRVVGVAGVAAVAGRGGPAASRQEQPRQAPRQFARHLPSGSSCRPEPVGHSTLQRVAVEVVIALQRLDEQVVDRKPDRPAPVRVAAEQAGVRFARLVVDAILLAAAVERRTDAPRGSARASGCRRARGTRSRRACSAARAPAARATESPAAVRGRCRRR